jgi:putative mRNA 3-end processing factor
VEIRFLGGADEVGSLGMVVKDGNHQVLFDYGMTPARPPEYPLPVPRGVQFCFLSHCHLDHSGMTPVLAQRGSTRVVTTELTREIMELLLTDALKVARSEHYPERFTLPDVHRVVHEALGLGRRETFRSQGLEVDLVPAGHVPGATMFRFRGSKDILFTGDVNSIPTHLVDGAEPAQADVLVMESTYAGREHPDRKEEERRFVREVEGVVSRGGQVIVPAFAVGRTQEVLMCLAESDLEVWVDGMGRKVNDLYLDASPGYLRDRSALQRALERVNVVEDPRDRITAQDRGEVIVTTGGMLDGGPVLHYLGLRQKDPTSAVFLVGFQVEDSNGRQLVERGTITVAGVQIHPKTQLRTFDFSSHAGHSDLVGLVRKVNPSKVVLMHGDQRERLAESLAKDYPVVLPKKGEDITL